MAPLIGPIHRGAAPHAFRKAVVTVIGDPQEFDEAEDEVDGSQDMGQLLDSMQPLKPVVRGDVVEGIIMRSDAEGILVNIGHKAEGLVPSGEMKSIARSGAEPLKVGDEIVALVVQGETAEGAVVLSIDRAMGEKGWRVLEKALESGDLLNGTILGFNRGGCIAEVEGVQAFVPMSQLVSVSRNAFRELQQPAQPAAAASVAEETDQAEEEAEVAVTGAEPEARDEAEDGESTVEPIAEPAAEPAVNPYIGREIELKVLEVNRGRNRAILSERQAMQEQREQRKSKLIEELSEGEVRRGRVTGISSFGAFVDLGGADGLVHISELSWNPVRSPDEVLRVGDEVDTYVLRVDAVNKKIALSLKRLQPEPWETIHEKFQVGDIVEATVTKLTEFGAFARVKDSVEGLIHISELSSQMVQHPREVVKEGDDVKVKILRIEPERRRLGLSLVQAGEEGY
jgi:small subunit ribosomal protein S1